MQIHQFYKTTHATTAYAKPPHTLYGCDSLATFQKSHPGEFIALPDGYEPCQPGFRPYKQDSGVIVGLKVD